MKRVLDGRDLLDAFKKEHGIKSDDLARSLMQIETFRPVTGGASSADAKGRAARAERTAAPHHHGLDDWDDDAGMTELQKRMFE